LDFFFFFFLLLGEEEEVLDGEARDDDDEDDEEEDEEDEEGAGGRVESTGRRVSSLDAGRTTWENPLARGGEEEEEEEEDEDGVDTGAESARRVIVRMRVNALPKPNSFSAFPFASRLCTGVFIWLALALTSYCTPASVNPSCEPRRSRLSAQKARTSNGFGNLKSHSSFCSCSTLSTVK
jgi:hypothetical protein